MNRIYALLITFSYINLAFAQNPSYSWFIGDGGTGADRSAGVVTDASGNIYSANSFVNTATFNTINLIGAAKGSGANFDSNLLITKTNASKTTLWHVQSSNGAVSPTAIATSTSGIYVAGTMRAIVNTANQSSTANIVDAGNNTHNFSGLGSAGTSAQAFLCKLNDAGHFVWVKEFNSNNKATAVIINSITSNNDGDIIISGSFVNSLIVPGNITPYTTTSTTRAAFVTKINATTGNEMWTISSGGRMSSEDLTAITIDNDGAIYAAGIFRNVASPVATNFGSINFTPSKDYSLVLIKITENGVVEYVRSFDNDKDTRVSSIAIDNQRVYVSGAFRGDGTGIGFSVALSASAGYLNGYIAAFGKSNGNEIWQKTIASPGISDAAAITLAPNGKLYAFGAYANKTGSVTAGNVIFGNGFSIADTNPTNSSADLYLATYEAATGTTLHVQTVATSSSWETANGIAASNNQLYLSGTTNATALNLGGSNTYATKGGYDYFILTYNIPNPSTHINWADANKAIALYNQQSKLLTIKNAKAYSIQLTDISGKTILKANIENDNQSFDFKNINNNIIIGNLKLAGQEIIRFKIIK